MDDSNDNPTFDFDYWSRLARENPEQFEEERDAMIRSLIDEAPEHLQQRIRGLQWQIDQTRERASSNTEACIRLNEMMWQAIYGKDGLLDSIEHPRGRDQQDNSRPAQVIPLKNK